MPTISVIIPVYKVELYIHRCVDSILNQTYTDFELIMVDDGSPDNCGAICDEYAEKDSRIHVIHQENGGLSAARNAGIDWAFANSDSRWLAFIDSDDWIHKDYLKILRINAEQHRVDISACSFYQTDSDVEDETITTQNIYCAKPEPAYCENYPFFMSACAKIYRKRLFSGVRFPVGKIHEDCYITQIPLFSAGKVAVSTAQLYYYYCNQNSITRQEWSEKRMQEVEAHEARLAWLEQHHLERPIRRELKECVHVSFLHANLVAHKSAGDRKYLPYLKKLRGSLRTSLHKARRAGVLSYNRELRWHYILAYTPFPLWRFARWLQNKKWEMKSESPGRN